MASFTIINQAPHHFDPLDHKPVLTADPATGNSGHDIETQWQELAKTYLINPVSASQPVNIADDRNNHLNVDDIARIVALPSYDDHDTPDNNATAMDLLSKLTVGVSTHHDLPVSQMFLSQALTELGAPAPSPRVIYSATHDVIPAAKKMLSVAAQSNSSHAFDKLATATTDFFAAIACTYQPHIYGMSFLTADEFTAFTAFVHGEATLLANNNVIDPDTFAKFQSFTALKLDGLTEAIRLRKSTFDYTPDYSFARVLVHLCHQWVERKRTTAQQAGEGAPVEMLAFDTSEWITPRAMVFVSVDAHARATTAEVNAEWSKINASLTGLPSVISPNKITKLTAALTSAQHIQNQAAQAQRNKDKDKDPERRGLEASDFKVTPPKATEIANHVSKIILKLGQVNKSQNIQRFKKKTMSRASRRNPDNPDAHGTMVVKRFLPDIHVYADCSGSISTEDYRATMLMLMQLAKKWDINIYFSSFSHVISKEVMLPVKGKSMKQMYALLESVPKVSGGTDYYQVWDYIMANRERQRRINIMTTDFEFLPSSWRKTLHPANMFYVPSVNNASQDQWEWVVDEAKEFANAMAKHDPNIDQKLLGMGL